MRITFVLPTAGLVGGIKVVAIYADRLQQRGHEVFVVSQPPRRPELRERLRALVREWRWLDEAPGEWNSSKGAMFFSGLGIAHKVLESRRPVIDADLPDADVVVATWWETAFPVAGLSRAKGAKAYFVQDYGGDPGQPLDKLAETWQLPLHKITISPFLLRLVEQECGDTDVTLAFNGVDFEQFWADPRGKQDRPVVGLMYSARPQKRTDVMLKAISIARETLPDLGVVAFGGCELDRRLPLPAGSIYHQSAPQHKLREIYAACDAWLFGSSSEGFGLPILEAMACRTPVVATPAGAAPELIAEGGGVLVGVDDPADMARGIVEICSKPDAAWRRMSDRAFATAQANTWEQATDAFEAGLQRAIDKTTIEDRGSKIEDQRSKIEGHVH